MTEAVRAIAPDQAAFPARHEADRRARACTADRSPQRTVRPRVPGAGPGNPGDAGFAGASGVPLDYLRPGRGRSSLGLFRPDRHHRLRPGQVPADGKRQGHRAARDRQGRGDLRKQRHPGERGRHCCRTRPVRGRGRRRGREGRVGVCSRRNAAPEGGAHGGAGAGVLARPRDRLAGRRVPCVAPAGRSGSRGRPRPARGRRLRLSTRSGRKNRPSATCCWRRSRRRRGLSRPFRSASTCAPSSS